MIEYIIGDAVYPKASGNKVIAHVCNDVGAWGAGFVLALSARWDAPETEYRKWYKGGLGFALGQVQFVSVENDIWVANIIGQHGIRYGEGLPPVRYEAIRIGLCAIREFAQEHGASVHMPKIGSGLAGGKWDMIEAIINMELIFHNISTTVYSLR